MSPRRRRRLSITLTTLCALLIGIYTAAASISNPSPPDLTLTADASANTLASEDEVQEAIASQLLPTALSWAESDRLWTNSNDAHSLASISKLITVLVCLDEAPLDADPSTWPDHVWTEDDWQRQQEYIADGGVAFPVEVGTIIPLQDMFTLIFLPSANDMVSAYAYSVFEDSEGFQDAVANWAKTNDLPSLTMVEPSGMDERNTATTEDLIKIAKIALHNDVVTQFTDLPNAEVPGFGYVENTSPLLGVDEGIIGLKTGRTLTAGFNLLVAQKTHVGDRELTKISLTLGRASLEERAQSGREGLAVLEQLPQEHTLIERGTVVATGTDWAGNPLTFTAGGDATTWLLPGEEISATTDINLTETVAQGQQVGNVKITTPTGTETLPVMSAQEISPPGLWWKLTHPWQTFNIVG